SVDLLDGGGSRFDRLHHNGFHTRSFDAGKQSHQEEPTSLQHPASGRQNAPIHQTYNTGRFSTSVHCATREKRWRGLFWPVYPRLIGQEDAEHHLPVLSATAVHHQDYRSAPKTVLAVLHQPVPGSVRAENDS